MLVGLDSVPNIIVRKNLKNEFRKKSILQSLTRVRKAILLGISIYMFFLVYDYFSHNSDFHTLLINRIVVCTIAFFFYGLSYTKKLGKYYFISLSILFLTAGYGTMHAMIYDHIYISSVFSVTVFFALVPYNSLRWVTIQNVILIISFYTILSFFTDLSQIDILKYTSLLISISVVTFLVFYSKQKIEWESFVNNEKMIGQNYQLKVDKTELQNQAALAKILQNSTNPSLGLNDFLQMSLDIILEIPWLNIVSKGSIFVTNNEGNLRMVASKDLKGLTKTCAIIKPGQCLCGKALLKKELLFSSCVTADHDIQPEGMTPHGHFNIPMMMDNKVLGVLNLYVTHNHVKKEGEVVFLKLVTDAIASVIYRHQLEKEREAQNFQLKRYFTAIEQSGNTIVFSDLQGNVLYANPYFEKLTGYSIKEIKGKNLRILNSGKTPKNDIQELWETIRLKKTWRGEFINVKKDGTEFIEQAVVTPILNNEGEIVEYMTIKEDVTKQKETFHKIILQKEIIEKSYQKINDSIEYAQRIQNSMLASNAIFEDIFEDVSLLYLPKDLVGGDFYMARQKNDKIYVAVADCTGHGVPGALVSALGTQELSHLIETCECSVGEMLYKLNANLNKLLNNDNLIGSDGMDLTLVCFDLKNKTFSYAGAKGIFFIYQNDELQKLKTDRVSIGQKYDKDFVFSTHVISYQKGDTIYLLSDGLIDQTSITNNKRIGSKRVKELLSTISVLNKTEKQISINNFLSTHKSSSQTDDITLLSLRLC